MRWIRSHIRWGSRVALVALALQFVLAFGHVHPAAGDHGSRGLLVGPAAATDTSDAVLPGSNGPGQKSDGAIDPFCPICASIQLIAGSVNSCEPALASPAYNAAIEYQTFGERISTLSPYALFHARAPPLI